MHERRVSGLHRSSPGYFGMPLWAFLVSPGRGQGATESFWHSDHGSHEYDSLTKKTRIDHRGGAPERDESSSIARSR
jgi:hypothetical protein